MLLMNLLVRSLLVSALGDYCVTGSFSVFRSTWTEKE
jgi:hypothetical protein